MPLPVKNMHKFGNLNWAGRDVPPMPGESLYSVLSRLGSRNALTVAQLKAVCGDKSSARNNVPSLIGIQWTNRQHFKLVTGWEMPSDNQMLATCLAPDFIELFFEQNLWFCPLCLGEGYHSIWHQFFAVKHCPIHNCALLNKCVCCNKLLPKLELSRNIFLAPYQCCACGQPLCGVNPCNEAFEGLSLSNSEMASIFLPFRKWVQDSRHKILILERLHASASFKAAGWHSWCVPREYFRRIATITHPLPVSYYSLYYPHLFVITWRVRMTTVQIVAPEKLRVQKARRITANQVYRSTLFRLQLWIVKTIRTENFFSPSSSIGKVINGCVDATAWPAEALAYVLMRIYLEAPRDPTLHADTRRAKLLDKCPQITMHTVNGKIPRLCWRATFVAIYCSFLQIVLRKRSKGRLDLRTLALNADYLITKFNLEDEPNFSSGGVVVPIPESCLFSLYR
jgi:hypothetical protein